MRIFVRFVLALGLTLGVAKAALADQLSPVQVVEQQLDAFATGDWDTAYSFAAPSIKAAFPSPQIFEIMVYRGYAYMLEPLDAAVSLVQESAEQAIVEAVFVSDKTDVSRVAYVLERAGDAWRINGVYPFQETDSAV